MIVIYSLFLGNFMDLIFEWQNTEWKAFFRNAQFVALSRDKMS